MLTEAPLTGMSSFPPNRRPVGSWTATLWAILLVTVAFVPAMAPDAAAVTDAGTCIPSDPRIDASLVLDHSGSMEGDKLADAKDGSIGFVENLTTNDQSGLVSYGSVATLDAELSPDHQATVDAIGDVVADGDTATGDAINLSHGDLADRSRPGVTPTMILLSDGKTNEGPDPVQEAEEAKADGVEIFTIAFGDGADEDELQEIASDPLETHFYSASSGDDLSDVYAAIRAQLDEPSVHAAEAFGVRVDASTDQPVRRATLHETPHAVAPPADEADATREVVEVAGTTVEVSSVSVEAGGASAPENVSAEARSRIADLRITDGSETLLEADLLAASAHAWSTPSDQAVSADGTRLAGVTVQGTPVAAPIPADTAVPLGDKGSLTLNEQVTTQQGENVTLRVNLVHLTLEDGPRTVDVTVGSTYAAAACSMATSYERPGEAERFVSGEPLDDVRETAPGSVAVNPAGEADNGQGDCAEADPCTAASRGGDAENADDHCDEYSPCTAASGEGDAENAGHECSGVSPCTAASGTGDARNAGDDDCYLQNPCVAASGTGGAGNAGDDCTDVSPCVAASGTGDAGNARHDCDFQSPCVAASGTGDAQNAREDDCARVSACVAASGTENASNAGGECYLAACVAASGTGDASNAGEGCADASACVAASGTGDASGTAAASGTGNASGAVAVSGGDPSDPVHVGPLACGDEACAGVAAEDDAEGALVAASGTGDASAPVAASGAGSATNPEDDCEATVTVCLAVSGIGDADNAHDACDFSLTGTTVCLAASGAGDADGEHTAVSGTGAATGEFVAGGTGSCNGQDCHDVNPTGPARGHNTAASGTGSADARQGVAASGEGPASTSTGLAASGTDSAEARIGAAVSGTGEASSSTAGAGVSGTGPADTFIGPAVSGTGDADAGIGPAVSGTGDADTWIGVAVSGTGEADTSLGVAASGCSGLAVDLLVVAEEVASPAPVCADPPAGSASLLP